MGFLSPDLKRAAAVPSKPKLRGPIPIESLNKLSCSVCPRDKDQPHTPKMLPAGAGRPRVYMLGLQPSGDDDRKSQLWSGKASRAVLATMSRNFEQDDVRFGNILQCASVHADQGNDERETECCRPRVIKDIEDSKPLIVAGVGDEVLHWATGLPRNALTFRGTLIATKIGNHVCWYYPLIYPNFINSKRQGKSEYEWTMERDIAELERLACDSQLPQPVVHSRDYDKGIEYIFGNQPGDMQRLEEAFQWLLTLAQLGVDYETNGLRPWTTPDAKIWTAALGTFDRTIAFPVCHVDGWGTDTRMRKVQGMLGDLIAQSGKKVCHNLGFEQEWSSFLYGSQILRRTDWEDTMAMGHAFDERQGVKSLDVQCRINFGFFLKAQSRVDPSRPDWIKQFSLKEVLRYNGMDTKWCDGLATHQLPRIRADDRLAALYEKKVRVAPTLVLTSARGLPVDIGYAEDMVIDIDKKLVAIEQRLRALPEVRQYSARFGTFSVTNADHVLSLMRDICRRPEVAREDRKTGEIKWTSDEEALLAMPTGEVPSAPLILEHRGLLRGKSTYLLPIVERRTLGTDGELHAEYQSMVTVTGRLSSEMHNWPKHKHREVRGAVAPPADSGEWLVAADYGQIEFRVAGMLAADDKIIEYSWTGYDVHMFWAERIVKEYPAVKDWIVAEFGVDWDEKGMKTLRQATKNGWVFPQLFGSSSRACAARMHIPEDVSDVLGEEYWDEFRGAKKWQEWQIKHYQKNLYVETKGGFRRHGPMSVPELINMPIQGTACEIVLEAMNVLSERADTEDDIELQPAFNGHDDLTFRISDASLESKIAVISHEMCKPRFDWITVPLIVEVSVGARWHQLEEIAKYSSEKLFSLNNPYR